MRVCVRNPGIMTMTTVIAVETNCNEWKLRNFHMHYALTLRWKLNECKSTDRGRERDRTKNNIYDGAHVCSMRSKICAWCVLWYGALCSERMRVRFHVTKRVHLKPLTSIIILLIFRLSYYHHHHYALRTSLLTICHQFYRFCCSIRHSWLILLPFKNFHEFFAHSEMSLTVECMDFGIHCNMRICVKFDIPF